MSLLPDATLSISVNPGGNGGYLNVTGCVDVLGALNITVNSQPTAGANISFLESPCISNNGTSVVVVKAPGNDGCDGVQGTVGFTDETHLGVLFSEGQCEPGSSGLSKVQ